MEKHCVVLSICYILTDHADKDQGYLCGQEDPFTLVPKYKLSLIRYRSIENSSTSASPLQGNLIFEYEIFEFLPFIVMG